MTAGDIRALRPAATALLAAVALAAAWSCGAQDPAVRRPAAAAARCTPLAPGGQLVRVAADRLPVLLHVPPGAPPPSGRRPLVVMLPGAGQDGPFAEAYTGYSGLADRRGFLVAYPTATGASPFWNVSGDQPGKPGDVAYLRRVIGALTGPPTCADPDRVTATGASNGGGMTAVLACAAGDLLAAAAPVAGGYATLPPCRSQRPLPLLEIHSLADPVVPYRGKGRGHAGAVSAFLRAWRQRNHCAGAPRRSRPAAGVQELAWRCRDGARVVHDRLRDAPHGWPGGPSLSPSSTTARTWRFLSRFRRR
jgi:polyhydroxybutyrate depolymerase